MSTQGKPPPFDGEDPGFDKVTTPIRVMTPHPRRNAVPPPPPDHLTPIDFSLPPVPLTALKRQQLFGRFEWAPDPIAGNPERIRIIGDWAAKNVVMVKIPQLEKLSIWPTVRFHKLGVKQLLGLWAAWDDAGLLDRVKTWNGAFVTRFKRGKAGSTHLEDLSNHTFASAFDINAQWNPLGADSPPIGAPGCVLELNPLANQWGFVNGGAFRSRRDYMHYELSRLQP